MSLTSYIKRLFSGENSGYQSSVLGEFTDFHSHILPGVDDGVEEIDESLEILDAYAERGCRTLWLTPHIMEDIPNSTDDLRKRFENLKKHYNGPIELHLAAENMLDDLFIERFANNDILPINGSMLLVETSYYAPPLEFYDILENIKSKGYNIMLAHPERYNYMNENDYIKLKKLDINFQLNLLSLDGYYGHIIANKAKKMLINGWYNFIGTDIHSRHQIKAIDHLSANGRLRQHISTLTKNPQ